MQRRLLPSALLALFAAPAAGQSFNVDLGPNILFAPAPSAAYGGAAAQPGLWNPFQPTFTATELRDLSGALSGVTLRSDSASSFTVFPSVMMQGDDQALMEDFQITPNINTLVTWTIEGLADGVYDLFTYASDPSNAGVVTRIAVPGSPDPPQQAGGGWPGMHLLGTTYVRHRVTVIGGTLEFTGTVVGGQLDTGVVNGFQLVQGGAPLGTTYCTSNPNSTGAVGHTSALGSDAVADDELTLVASNLPAGSFAFFVTSLTQATTQNPGGSQGVLCLGGSVGRFDVLVGQTDGAGTYRICTSCVGAPSFSLSAVPQPTGPVAVQPGETWSFQCWHRDANPGATSNFTDALEITFR